MTQGLARQLGLGYMPLGPTPSSGLPVESPGAMIHGARTIPAYERLEGTERFMRVTNPEQARVLSRLATVANGDIELVQRAIRASSKDNQPAEFEEVVRRILEMRRKRKRATEAA
jgi:hypothetical protein